METLTVRTLPPMARGQLGVRYSSVLVANGSSERSRRNRRRQATTSTNQRHQYHGDPEWQIHRPEPGRTGIDPTVRGVGDGNWREPCEFEPAGGPLGPYPTSVHVVQVNGKLTRTSTTPTKSSPRRRVGCLSHRFARGYRDSPPLRTYVRVVADDSFGGSDCVRTNHTVQ